MLRLVPDAYRLPRRLVFALTLLLTITLTALLLAGLARTAAVTGLINLVRPA